MTFSGFYPLDRYGTEYLRSGSNRPVEEPFSWFQPCSYNPCGAEHFFFMRSRSGADIRKLGKLRIIAKWIFALENVTERSGFFLVCYGAERIGYPLLGKVADCHGTDNRRHKCHGSVGFDRTAP